MLLVRKSEYILISNAWGDFSDLDNFVAEGAQTGDNLPIHALICDEVHAALSGRG